MKKETLFVAIASFVFGCLVGLIIPKLFSSTNVSAPHQHDHPASATSENVTDPKAVRKQYEHVLKEYEKIAQNDPKNFEALVTIGNVNFELNNYSAAIEAYQKALEINPENSNARVDMAICYRRLGKLDEAIEGLNRTIELDPKHIMAHYNKAIIMRYDKNDLDESKKEWEAFLKLAPNHSQASFAKDQILEIQNLIKQRGAAQK